MEEKSNSKQFDITQYLPFGENILHPGSQLKIKDIWMQTEWIYCRLFSKNQDHFTDFEVCAALEVDGDKFLILGDTPDMNIDSYVLTFNIAKLVSDSTIELVEKHFIESHSERWLNALNSSKSIKLESVKEVFGKIRDYHNPA